METVSFVLMNLVPVSASWADDIVALIILAVTRIGMLCFGGGLARFIGSSGGEGVSGLQLSFTLTEIRGISV